MVRLILVVILNTMITLLITAHQTVGDGLLGVEWHNAHISEIEGVIGCKDLEKCYKLAEAIVYESRGETKEGRRLVGSVILNRVEDRRFPDSVYGVVHQRRQFSYLRDMEKQSPPTESDWDKAYRDAYYLLKNGSTPDILWYHSKKVKPIWRNSLGQYAKVGNHIFYKDLGK